MGVDYDALGGIGVAFTDDMVDSCVKKGIFTAEEWEYDYTECLEKLCKGKNIQYGEAGDYCYSGNPDDRRLYLFVQGNTLGEVWANADGFVEFLCDIGYDTDKEHLLVIEDMHVY